MDITKLNGFAVIQPDQTKVSVVKVNGYAVMGPSPQGNLINVAKTLGYAVIGPGRTALTISGFTAYAVVFERPPRPQVFIT